MTEGLKPFVFTFEGSQMRGSTRIEMLGTTLTITVSTDDGGITPDAVEISDHADCGDPENCLRAAARDCLDAIQEGLAGQMMSGGEVTLVTLDCGRCSERHVIGAIPTVQFQAIPAGWDLVGRLN
jgi:hypothetical protein